MKVNIIKRFSILILSGLFVFSGTGLSFAQGFPSSGGADIKLPTLDDILDDVEQRYAYDPNALRRARHKETAPEVDIFFDNTTPKEGEEVTATALPKGFKNSNENLYYTWFIMHDGESNIENAKREAMGIVARGSFDPEFFGIDYDEAAGDNDSFRAPIGGKDGVGAQSTSPVNLGTYENNHFLDPASKEVVDTEKITRCYRHNFGGVSTGSSSSVDSTHGLSGKDMIVKCSHKFPKAKKDSSLKINYEDGTEKTFVCNDNYEVGDGYFGKNEESCWRLNPSNPDTDGDGINDEADLAGLAQTQFTWSYRKGDRVGVIIEGTSIIPINEDNTAREEGDGEGMTFSGSFSGGDGGGDAMEFLDGHEEDTEGITSYYKITWAGLGVCDNKEKNKINDDDCDSSKDYGLPFLKLVDAYEKGGELLKADLIKTPENPQFNIAEEEYSDLITVTAGIKNKEVDKNFVYFDWDIYKCDETDTKDCTYLEAEMEKITEGCGSAETLGECAEYDNPEYDNEDTIESNSYAEGIGQDKIIFRPLAKLMEREKEYFKVVLKTKEYKSSNEYSVSEIVFPIVKNDAIIKFFKLNKGVGGKLSFSEKEDEICTTGIYKDVCPVYPFQVLVAMSEFSDTNKDKIEGYIWQHNRESINAPLKCQEYFGKFEDKNGIAYDICNREDLAIFPIIGGDLFLGSVTSNIEKENEEDLISERIYSVNQPLIKVVSNDLKTVWPFVKHDSSESDNVFQAEPGSEISLKANIIPDYLDLDEIKLTWFYNGEEVDDDFINKNEDLEVELEENTIALKIPKNMPSSILITSKIEKIFYADDIRLLGDGWNILNTNNLSKETNVTIKRWISEEEEIEEESASLKLFLASTVKNIPKHLLFIVRLAIILVIILVIIFGCSYLLEYKERGK